MYAKKITTVIAMSAISSALIFSACKKDVKSGSGTDIESAQDNALAEANFNDVTTITDQAALGGSVNFRTTADASANREDGSLGSGCATVSVDTVSVPHMLTVDFGSTDCLCNDGRKRRGKIKATYTGRYRDAGTVISISFDNYFVNDNQVMGTKKITNLGLSTAGNPLYSIEVNGQIIKADGAIITWVSSRQREWLAGSSTPLNWLDDVYSITGTASGTTAKGKSYSISISTPLVRKMVCRWFESGVVNITAQGEPTLTLDYGNTGCDANATVTVLNYTFPIVLN